jgi:hypothetical protein
MIVVRFYKLFLEIIIFFLESNIKFFEFRIELLDLLLIVRLGYNAALATTIRCQPLLGLGEPYLSDTLLSTVTWSRYIGQLSAASITLKWHINVVLISKDRSFERCT